VFPSQGDLGPFNPGLPVQVPLWMAINLKQRQKCRIVPPEWMDVEKLEQIRDNERREETFTPMPNLHYMELTKLLLNHFVREQEAHAKLDNLTLMEINTISTFFTESLNHMYKLRTSLQTPEDGQTQEY
ncbi:hypothetical protein AB205_0149720, partial [Aquarana catesbeiana]